MNHYPSDYGRNLYRDDDDQMPYGDPEESVSPEKARIAELESELAGLWSLVIQPWKREGDGLEMFKVNLAWWDSAETEEEGKQMVRELIARKAKVS